MDNRRETRVLVAGGAGFLGSHLCERLVGAGARVVCLDSFLTGRRENLAALIGGPRFELLQADVVDPLPSALERGGFDQIYNLACVASPTLYQNDPEHTLMTSVTGTQRLLRLAEGCGARLLLASTSEVYGDPLVHPQREGDFGNVSCTGPRACYDEGKRAAEALAFDFDRKGRAEVRVARIFNTYGPRLAADDGRVVPAVIAQALAGEDVTVFGDGRQTRSFCYVDDMIEGLMRLMACDGPQPGPVNLGDPNEVTVLDLVARILALTGSASRIVTRPLPMDDPRRRRPDIGRAGALLDWRPVTPLDQGLEATIGWMRGQRPPSDPAEALSLVPA